MILPLINVAELGRESGRGKHQHPKLLREWDGNPETGRVAWRENFRRGERHIASTRESHTTRKQECGAGSEVLRKQMFHSSAGDCAARGCKPGVRREDRLTHGRDGSHGASTKCRLEDFSR